MSGSGKRSGQLFSSVAGGSLGDGEVGIIKWHHVLVPLCLPVKLHLFSSEHTSDMVLSGCLPEPSELTPPSSAPGVSKHVSRKG